MNQIKTRIGSLKLPPWLRGVTTVALIVFAVAVLVFWIWAKPSLWVAVLMLALQALTVVGMGIVLTGRFPTLRRNAVRSRGAPEELTQADWDELRTKRHQRRRLVLRLVSTVSIVLAIVLLWGQGLWGKILSVLIAYIYYWVLYSRSKVTSPYPGLSLERVGADIGEPVSVSPARLGWLSIALRWIKGEFPAKPIGRIESRFLFRKIWAALPLPASLALALIFLVDRGPQANIPWLVYLVVGGLGTSFWLWWTGLGWPAIKYTLGAGEEPDVFISRPKIHPEGMEIEALYNRAALFNTGSTETRRGGAVHWDPAVMTVAGLAKESMNLLWCPEWFMRRILGARGKQR